MKAGWICLLAVGWVTQGVAADRSTGERAPVVRSLDFKNFHGVSAKEIVERLHDRDIEMMERAYSKECVATARGIVEELLAEKGQRDVRVTPTVERVNAHKVRLVFTAEAK
ncbi:MAG: hypothetical protein ABI759_19900 [Candidatus Solibacter sp.]